MHGLRLSFGILGLILGAVRGADAAGWQSLFNGRDLDGWSGDPRLWSVEDGVLTGRTDSNERKIDQNSYLLCGADLPGDFELEFMARVTGENSGVQYRSWKVEDVPWGIGGMQCDLHPQPDYLAMFYDERGEGIICKHGEKVTAGKGRETLSPLPDPPPRLGEWNRYRIQVVGRRYRHQINGVTVAEYHDKADSRRPLDGILGLQLHVGQPMTVEFKEIRVRPLEEWPRSPDEASMVPVPGMPGTGLRDGFRLEKIFDVPGEMASWVAITRDDQGNLYCARQYGGIWKVSQDGEGEFIISETGIPIQSAQGLLWHKGTLWISSTESPEGGNGVWRVDLSQSTPGEPELVRSIPAGGEHGLHTLKPSPDGQFIYLVAGNHCPLPDLDRSLVPRVWAEDQLLPRRPDANGHAANTMAPGGWIARFRPDGSEWTLVAIGLRNSFGIDFNLVGDLFTYDADMEWDFGMPWYRPTRICRVIPGAEFGWRNGTGKWPESYEDSLPPLLNIGPGSPTALISGRGTRFPARYQRALFAFDWTYATIHAILFEPGEPPSSIEFLTGNGMPLTDAVVGIDGALYFLTGGRNAASALWRITYEGSEITDPLKPLVDSDLVAPTIDEAWKQLGSIDRIERFQARTRLEMEEGLDWSGHLENEREPWAVISAAIGVARTGEAEEISTASTALLTLDFAKLEPQARINWLRAFGLIFARHHPPDEPLREALISRISPAFPTGEQSVDRELCRMLCYLNAPRIVGKVLDWADNLGPQPPPDWLPLARRNPQYGADIEAMIARFPSADRIHALYCLRVVPGPWTPQERARVFGWFEDLLNRQGGRSYAGFIKDLREQTLATCTPEERSLYADAGKGTSNPLADLPSVQGPGRSWTVDEIVALAESGLENRSKEAGGKMFQAALCSACHRFDGSGGSAGPDLTAVGGRFSLYDLADAIVTPGKTISDQYAWETFSLRNGSQLTARIIEETQETIAVSTNAFDPTVRTEIFTSDVIRRERSPASPMPPGLINRLNPDELKDLLAYMLKLSS